MLLKGVIVPSSYEEGECIFTLFIVPKPNGKYRPIIYLKILNTFVHYDHFKQETFKIVLDLIQKGDFFKSVDLGDAYFYIPIHEEFQKYLKLSWNGSLYKFICLPFGLKSAPYVFNKVFSWFREHGIRCNYYIDDSLNMNQRFSVCQTNTEIIVRTFKSLGFLINEKKSALVPSQKIIFFGF